MYWAKKSREILPFLAGQIANIGHFEVKFLRYIFILSLLVHCTLMYPSNYSFVSVPKNRFLG